MARISYLIIPEGYDKLLARGLRPGDRFVIPRLTRANRFISYPRRQALKQRSLLPIVGPMWLALTQPEKDAWTEAATYSNQTGYRLFVQDTCERIRLELPGVATPSNLHQFKAGILHVETPATEILLTQPHPRVIWTRHKKRGTQSQYEFVQITEDFALPLTIELSYKTNLTSIGAGARARFYARVRSLYQGRDIYTNLSIDLPLISDWARAENTLSAVQGQPIAYDLFLEIYNAEGNFWLDNPVSFHSGQNWVRDPKCDNLQTGFTSVWFLVPKNWAAVELPEGADYGSIYVDS